MKGVYERKHKRGFAMLLDTRNDPTWGDVEAVERFYNENEELTTVVNHRDFETAIANYN